MNISSAAILLAHTVNWKKFNPGLTFYEHTVATYFNSLTAVGGPAK